MSPAIAVYNTSCSLGIPPADLFVACVDQDWICYAAGTEKQGPWSYEEGRMGWCAGRFGQGRAALGQVDSYICKLISTSALLGGVDLDTVLQTIRATQRNNSSHHSISCINSLVDERQDLSSDVLSPGLLVVHDTGRGGEDDLSERSSGEEQIDPVLDY
jgi:hypothetical protein